MRGVGGARACHPASRVRVAQFCAKRIGAAVTDCGTNGADTVDYPDFAHVVARLVASGACESGIVIDGGIRDVAELDACDIGFRALALVPMPTQRRMAGQTQVPVQIQGVWVRPGDWLYADVDGVVIGATRLV